MVTRSGRLRGHGRGRTVSTVVVTLVGASLVSPVPAWPSVMRLSRIVNFKPHTMMSQGVQKRMAPNGEKLTANFESNVGPTCRLCKHHVVGSEAQFLRRMPKKSMGRTLERIATFMIS